MMGTYICAGCGRRWSGISPSWWCEICIEKHHKALQEYEVDGAKTKTIGKFVPRDYEQITIDFEEGEK